MRQSAKVRKAGPAAPYTCICPNGFEGPTCTLVEEVTRTFVPWAVYLPSLRTYLPGGRMVGQSVHVDIRIAGTDTMVMSNGVVSPEFDVDSPSYEIAAGSETLRLDLINTDENNRPYNFQQPQIFTYDKGDQKIISPSFTGKSRFGGMLGGG
jgi:hypothetical protein